MCHRGITLLRIFPHGFADHDNFLLPRQRKIYKPIAFGLIVPDVTPEITRARAQLKTVTRAKIFRPQDSLDAQSVHFGIVCDDIHDQETDVLANKKNINSCGRT